MQVVASAADLAIGLLSTATFGRAEGVASSFDDLLQLEERLDVDAMKKRDSTEK
jgi:hypothetical protein